MSIRPIPSDVVRVAARASKLWNTLHTKDSDFVKWIKIHMPDWFITVGPSKLNFSSEVSFHYQPVDEK